MKRPILLILLLIAIITYAKNPIKSYKDLQSGKKEKAFKSFQEIFKNDSNSVIANYSLALLYSDASFNGYDLELSYKYSKRANMFITSNNWNEQVGKSDLKNIEKLKIVPTKFSNLNDSILNAIFSKVKIANSIVAYNQFIKKYPESLLIYEAKENIESLAFDEAKTQNTIKAFQNFINQYPTSKLIGIATANICKLEFQVVEEKNTIEDYKNFISKYPYSFQANSARKNMVTLAFNDARKNNTITAYKNFIKDYPTAFQVDEAKQAIKKLGELAFNDACKINTIEAYEQFINAYPNSKESADAILKLNTLKSLGILPIIRNGKIGFVNKNDEIIIQPKYDLTLGFNEGYAFVKENGYWGVIDITGKEMVPFRYEDASSFEEGLARVKLNNKWGFINCYGQEIVAFEYDDPPLGFNDTQGKFINGLAAVNKNGLWGYVNKNGVRIIDCIYLDARGSFDGLCAIQKDTGLFGCLNENNEIVVPFRYQFIGEFNEGLARVQDTSGKEGFIDGSGKEVIPCKFNEVDDFNEGLAFVSAKQGLCYNSEGELITHKPGSIYATSEGGSIYGYINKQGEYVIPEKYSRAFPFHDGLARVEIIKDIKNNKSKKVIQRYTGFIDKSGKEIIPFNYTETGYKFSDGLAFISENNVWYCVDNNGHKVLKCNYEGVNDFDKGLACVYKNGLWGAIDKTGKEVIPCQFNGSFYFRTNGLAKVTKQINNNSIVGYIDRKGNFITEKSKNNQKEKETTSDNSNSLINLSNEQVEQKAKYIIGSFTRFSAYAEDKDNLFVIEISRGEMDEPNSKDELILSGKMFQYVKYQNSNNTPMGQIISLATGNAQIIAAEKVMFHCSKSELAKDWSILHCDGFFHFTTLKINIDWSSLKMHTRLVVKDKDYALKLK